MTNLYLIFVATVIIVVSHIRPLSSNGESFGRDTTATIRGFAMIAIILHHVHNKYGLTSAILSPAGYIATGIFFFISGYGNSFSLNKRKDIEFVWLLRKIIKIVIPFLCAYLVYLLVIVFKYPDLYPYKKEIIVDILTVSLPHQVSWFPKIILACFLLHWILKKIAKSNEKHVVIFMFAVIACYMAIMITKNTPNYWYVSLLCYPLGCLIALLFPSGCGSQMPKTKKIMYSILFAIAFLLLFLSLNIGLLIRILCPMALSLFLYFISSLIEIKTRLLEWIGNNSFETYVFQAVNLQLFYFCIDEYKWLYPYLVVLGTLGSVFLYLLLRKFVSQISLKRMVNDK